MYNNFNNNQYKPSSCVTIILYKFSFFCIFIIQVVNHLNCLYFSFIINLIVYFLMIKKSLQSFIYTNL